MKVKIKDIAIINREHFDFSKYQKVQYLDIANVASGSIISLQEYDVVNDNIPSRAQRAVKSGTIIISTVRPNLKHYCYLNNPEDNMVVSSGFVTIDAKESIVDSRYLYYILSSDFTTKYLSQISSTAVSSYPSFNPIDIENLEINILNSIEEQKKISSILTNIDSKIATNKAIISQLDAMAKLIYDYWFVQFDFPDENGRPYKSSGGKMVWNEELKREIPERWTIGSLSLLGEIVGGGTPSTENISYFSDNGIAWATPKDLADNKSIFFSHGERDITKEGLQNSSAVLMPKGTVLMTSRAPIGYLAIAANEVSTNQGFKSIIPKDGVSSEFIYYTLNMMMPYIKRYGVGSTFAEVSKYELDSIKVLIPHKNILKKFNINKIFELILNLETQRVNLVSLRDFLLPLLMNGQVKIA